MTTSDEARAEYAEHGMRASAGVAFTGLGGCSAWTTTRIEKGASDGEQ